MELDQFAFNEDFIQKNVIFRNCRSVHVCVGIKIHIHVSCNKNGKSQHKAMIFLMTLFRKHGAPSICAVSIYQLVITATREKDSAL